MKKSLYSSKLTFWAILLLFSANAFSQTLEWRLVSPLYRNVDPDGAGPAVGSISFTLQIHTLTGTVSNITGLSTGWSWQSATALLPTTGAVVPTCGSNSLQQPGNIVMSSAFSAFTYNNVNQCSGSVNYTAGGQTFDRRSAGTIDGASIALSQTWTDVFTVTLWTKDAVAKGGYVAINSGAGGSPGAFGTYAVSDINANEFIVNSQTYAVPLAFVGAASPLPVVFSLFNAVCQPNKATSITWTTQQEVNNNYFEVEKSRDGTIWASIGKLTPAGNSSAQRSYEVTDPEGGAAQYRLKQVDKDGKTTYSGVVKTSCEGRNVYVTLYPVPARDVVNLVVGSDKTVKTTLQVYDSKGKLVINVAAPIAKGINNFKIPVMNLAVGEYFIKGTSSEIDISKRFTIVR